MLFMSCVMFCHTNLGTTASVWRPAAMWLPGDTYRGGEWGLKSGKVPRVQPFLLRLHKGKVCSHEPPGNRVEYSSPLGSDAWQRVCTFIQLLLTTTMRGTERGGVVGSRGTQNFTSAVVSHAKVVAEPQIRILISFMHHNATVSTL